MTSLRPELTLPAPSVPRLITRPPAVAASELLDEVAVGALFATIFLTVLRIDSLRFGFVSVSVPSSAKAFGAAAPNNIDAPAAATNMTLRCVPMQVPCACPRVMPRFPHAARPAPRQTSKPEVEAISRYDGKLK